MPWLVGHGFSFRRPPPKRRARRGRIAVARSRRRPADGCTGSPAENGGNGCASVHFRPEGAPGAAAGRDARAAVVEHDPGGPSRPLQQWFCCKDRRGSRTAATGGGSGGDLKQLGDGGGLARAARCGLADARIQPASPQPRPTSSGRPPPSRCLCSRPSPACWGRSGTFHATPALPCAVVRGRHSHAALPLLPGPFTQATRRQPGSSTGPRL